MKRIIILNCSSNSENLFLRALKAILFVIMIFDFTKGKRHVYCKSIYGL